MPDVTANSHQPPEDRFQAWVDALVDPAETIPVPDADLADLAGTAAFAQRTAGPGSAPSLSTDRTESMWEEIMHATPTPATLTPTLRASNGAREIASRALPSVPNTGWRAWLSTALLIAAIVVAGLAAAWRIAGPFDLAPGGNGPETANQPGIAGSATPTASAAGCPLTNDMLIFVGEVPHLHVEGVGPSLAVVEPDGDFVITCGGVDDPEPLMTGIANAMPLRWPGTVLLERVDGSVVVYNVATGERVALGDRDVVYGMYQVNPVAPPWLVSPYNAAATDWRITNLETMTSFVLSDELGGVLVESRTLSVTTADGSDIAVISIDGVFTSSMGPNVDVSLPPNPEDASTVEVPDGALVVDATFDTRRWIHATGSVAVSPDGSTIAYQTRSESDSTIRIEDAGSGDLLAALDGSNFVGTPAEDFAFDGDGDALVYLDGNDVWIATWDSGLSTTQVETGETRPSAVRTIDAPDRVVLQRIGDQVGPRTALTGNRAMAVLDTGTATVTDVDGLVADNNLLPHLEIVSLFDYVVTVTTTSESPDQVVLHLVDVDTGEPVLHSDPIPDAAITADSTVTSSGDGSIAVVNLDEGAALYLNANTGTVAPITVEPLSSLEQFEGVHWIIAPSHDGLYLYALGQAASATPTATPGGDQYFSVSLLSSDPNWPLPSRTMPNGTIIGIPAGSNSDEPAVLEAQEFATPAPTSTASHIAEAAGCDFDADIPVVTGSEPELPGTVLRLADGTLSLECGDEATVVAEEVAEVVPGSTWPGAVLLHMDDGSLRGINVITGAEGELGLFHDMVPQQVAHTRVIRWMLIPTSPEQIDWRIIDFETMDSLLLSDELGAVLPQPMVARFLATTPDAAVIGFPGIPVGAGSPMEDAILREATPPSATPTASLPSDTAALVIDGSLDNRHWTDASSRSFIPVAISPDGELLAVEQESGDRLTVRVERLADGALVADTDIDYGFTGSMAMMNEDAGLMHVTQDRIDLVRWNAAGEVTVETLVIFETMQEIPRIARTTDPDGVIVGVIGQSGESVTYLVDAASGGVTEMPGLLQTPFDNFGYNDGLPVGYVLAVAPHVEEGQSTIQMYDTATEQPVVISEPLDLAPAEASVLPAALRDRGETGIVFLPDGRSVVLDAARGESFVIEPPEGDRGQGWFVMPSAGGDALMMSRSGNGAFVRDMSPDAEWIEVEPGSFIGFVPGAGELPGAG